MAVYTNIRAAILDLALYRGDKTAFKISFFDPDDAGNPFDLTQFAGSLKMQIKTDKNNDRAIAELLEGTGLTVSTNELTIESLGINTEEPEQPLFYDVEGLTAGARLTILAGNVLTTEDVTRE